MNLDDHSSLRQDAVLFEPLSRVAYRHGMMLGVEAVQDEQGYNRRRLNRHQYWLHGAGTVVGLAVTPDHPAADPDESVDQALRLIVGPGIALDGLGREVVLHEPFCLDLRAWIEAKRDPASREWNGSDVHVPRDGALWLDIGIRADDCDHGLQPVIAHEVNAGIDPVATSRIQQGVRLDIEPLTLDAAGRAAFDTPPDLAEPLPGAAHPGAEPDLDAVLSQTERDYLSRLGGVRGELARLHAERLFRLQASDLAPDRLDQALEALARVMIARVRLATPGGIRLISHPAHLRINNLLRPFVTDPDLLAWVMSTHSHGAPP